MIDFTIKLVVKQLSSALLISESGDELLLIGL